MGICRILFFSIQAVAFLSCPELAVAQESTPTATIVEHIAPEKLKAYDFKIKDFTFVRLRYAAMSPQTKSRWQTDYPDADIFLSDRVRNETKLTVSHPTVLDIDDPALKSYPFAYISTNGGFELDSKQAVALRKYCNDGGFVLIDDSWGDDELNQITDSLKKGFSDRVQVELAPQHDIFHCVYDLATPPQVLSIQNALTKTGVKENRIGEASYLAIFNDKGRIMVLVAHNTDLADGWERCKEDLWYSKEYSEKLAFPMGINIVTYALLTHSNQ
jgi:hypothetical protein